MREIKFRAWDKDNSKMVDVVSYEKNYETKEGRYDLAWRNAYENENFLTYGMKIGEECEVMQYVGLSDINGNEIYESDIIQLGTEERFCVSWHDVKQEFTFRNNRGDYFPETYRGATRSDEYGWIIIGNIFENPELAELS